MEELEEDFEILIVAWLQSDDDNATNLAHSLSELAKKRALILPVVSQQRELLIAFKDYLNSYYSTMLVDIDIDGFITEQSDL